MAFDEICFFHYNLEGLDVFGDVYGGYAGAPVLIGDGHAVFTCGEFVGGGGGFAVVPFAGIVSVSSFG